MVPSMPPSKPAPRMATSYWSFMGGKDFLSDIECYTIIASGRLQHQCLKYCVFLWGKRWGEHRGEGWATGRPGSHALEGASDAVSALICRTCSSSLGRSFWVIIQIWSRLRPKYSCT